MAYYEWGGSRGGQTMEVGGVYLLNRAGVQQMHFQAR